MRALIGIIAFLIWGGISVQWYVCGVKGLCADDKKEVSTTISSKVKLETDTLEKEVEGQLVTFTISEMTIHFPFAKSEVKLSGNQKDSLNLIVREVKSSEAIILLHGNTDSIGSDENNLKLSKKRANWIKSLMVSYGLNEDKMIVESYGENKPIDSNQTKTGRAKNRRVDIFIKTK